MNLIQRRGHVQFRWSISQNFLVGGAVVDAPPVTVNHSNHVLGIFCDQLKQVLTLGQFAANPLQLPLLVDSVEIEQKHESG
ncbi:MAG: hypothetical protein WAK27_15540 [Candidatus Sulfotelmatobacter sp.]